MIQVKIFDSGGNKVPQLVQWNVGLTLRVSEYTLPEGYTPSLQYCNKNTDKAIPMTTSMNADVISSEIPNCLLTSDLPITVHLVAFIGEETDTASSYTVFSTKLHVKARQKPEEYVYLVNTPFYTDYIDKLDEDLKKLDNITYESECTDYPNEGKVGISLNDIGGLHFSFVLPRGKSGIAGPAGAPGDDYVLTDDDKAEIAGMVEVSGSGVHIGSSQPTENEDVWIDTDEDYVAGISDIRVEKVGTVTTITLTYPDDSVKTVEINDGQKGETGASGEKGADGANGDDGIGIINAEINESGELVLTYSDNSTVNLGVVVGADGKDGTNGADGKDGADGENGTDGTSVSVASVSESTADGGSNIVTFSDGNTLTVKNGSKGSTGEKGATPVKGTDYWTAEDKSAIVDDVVASLDGVPEYWKDHLDTKIDEIRLAMDAAGRSKSAFFFYSDAHWWKKTRYEATDYSESYTVKREPELLKYLYKNTSINKTNFGGDILGEEAAKDSDGWLETMSYLQEWRTALRNLPNHHSVIGNHDDGNETDNQYGEEWVYARMLSGEETSDMVCGDGFYYYIDSNCEKTRYLYLDTGYQGLSSIDDSQKAFIKNALTSTPDGWHIVAISHVWCSYSYVEDETTGENVFTVGDFTASASTVLSMFDEYNLHSGDYAGCSGKVEFCIGGHLHVDCVKFTASGIPVIHVEASALNDRGGSSYTINSTTETSLNAVIADYTNRKVNIIRVGRGASATVDLSNASTTTYYSVTNNLTNVTSSSTVTSIVSGGSFTTTLEAETEITSVVVTMGGTDVTSTAYNVDTGVISIEVVTGNIVITATAENNSTDEPDVTTYTNVLDTVGYTADKRLSASSGNLSDNAGTYVTGIIPILGGNKLYFKNIQSSQSINYGCNVAYYDSEGMFISGKCYAISDNQWSEFNDNGTLKWYVVDTTIIAEGARGYLRFSFVNIDDTSIITINEPIE